MGPSRGETAAVVTRPQPLAGRGHRRAVVRGSREPKPAQPLVDVAPARVEPGDHLLAEVAALAERAELGHEARLVEQVVLRHVAAEPRAAGLDPQGVEGRRLEGAAPAAVKRAEHRLGVFRCGSAG